MKEGCIQIIERLVVLGGDKRAVLMMASVPPNACYKGSGGILLHDLSSSFITNLRGPAACTVGPGMGPPSVRKPQNRELLV